ncbi:MAG: helix-turn-helix domain-containing protein [Acidobacteria bacterium]|nr:helix-turn-helix domain-containing protein [Acidobacteriota bacterium]
MARERLRRIVIDWLDDNFHFGDAETLIGADEDKSFLQNGILDSLGFVKLVLFLETTCGVTIDRKDIAPANFRQPEADLGLRHRDPWLPRALMREVYLDVDRDAASASAMTAFMTWLRTRHGVSHADYRSLHAWACEEYGAFWSHLLEWSGLPYSGDRAPACVGTSVESARFFPHVRLNYAECLLRPLDPAYEAAPAIVARDNGVSIRHLHNLFKQSGVTVCKWIWERRLKATREDLLDPAMAAKSISEIAYSRGFNDSAHFSRAFKERFHLSPSQLRNKGRQTPEQQAG